MTSAVFGRSIIRELYPEDTNGTPIQIPSASAATFYLFDTEPSYDAGTAGTGALQTVTAWTSQETTSPYKCSYAFSPLEDPYPESSNPTRGYWEALNVILQAGSDPVLLKRYFEVSRAKSADARPGTLTELLTAFPNATRFTTEAKLTEALPGAEQELRTDIEKAGIEWSTVANIPTFRLALAYKAIALACLGQMRVPGDKYDERHERFEEAYVRQLAKLPVKFDSDGDQVTDASKTTTTRSVAFFR